MVISIPTFLEDCECTSVQVFKWNQFLPNNSISPRFGFFMLLINTKFVLISKTDPQLQDVSYTTIPETFGFDLKLLSSSDNIKMLARDCITRTYQFSQYCVDNWADRITDYLTHNFVFDVEKILSCNKAAAPKTVIVVEIFEEKILNGCNDVKGVIRGDRDWIYSVDDIVNSLKRLLNLPLLYNEELGLIEVPALEKFEGIVLNHETKVEAKAEDDDKCAICLEEFLLMEDRDMIITRRTCCCHLFHGHCLAQWLWTKSSCPMCRSSLP